MIAKLIVYGDDRDAALARLGDALADYEIVGVATNVAFLRRVVAHDAFASGNVDTGLIARNHAALFPPRVPAPPRALLAAALAEVQALVKDRRAAARISGDPHSPWHTVDSFWPNSGSHALTVILADGETRHTIAIRRAGEAWRVALPGGDELVHFSERDGRLAIATADGEAVATVVRDGDLRHVFSRDARATLTFVDPLAHAGVEETHGGHLTAPMSGLVVAVMVEPGETVAKGAPLMILEAMKMEHTIAAPAAGKVKAVNYAAGDRVKEGADLVDIDDA
jgi:3-methylcrotonyl-CoA carboxylase alpha subunit